jgi:hypothetical protein
MEDIKGFTFVVVDQDAVALCEDDGREKAGVVSGVEKLAAVVVAQAAAVVFDGVAG